MLAILIRNKYNGLVVEVLVCCLGRSPGGDNNIVRGEDASHSEWATFFETLFNNDF
ncbi:MAG: hypothetical protein ACTHMM_25695 [Agriterribacter sp.]